MPTKPHIRRLPTIVHDQNGTALLEFAITLPVLLVLYLGCVQICDLASVYRKTTTTARTVADLASQQVEVSDGDLDSILNASAQVMAPHSASKLRMVVTQVTISNTGTATVDWSQPSGVGATALTVGSTYTLPTGVGVPNTSLIISRVNYDYIADIGGVLRTEVPLRDIIYMYPRSIKKIVKT
jgi:Flp pilus assembly protein TadG